MILSFSAPTAITSSTTAPASQTENIPQGNPGWTLKRRPGHWQDGPQPFSSSDVSSIPAEQVKGLTSTSSNSVKSGRRGNKTYTKAPGGVAKDEEDESDNYPPEFKARLAQMVRFILNLFEFRNIYSQTIPNEIYSCTNKND